MNENMCVCVQGCNKFEITLHHITTGEDCSGSRYKIFVISNLITIIAATTRRLARAMLRWNWTLLPSSDTTRAFREKIGNSQKYLQ